MKIVLLIISFFIGQATNAMGTPQRLPGNPISAEEAKHINDMGETTAVLNQVAKPRGMEDQQMMEEKEMKEAKEKERLNEIEIKDEELIPIERSRINYE